jgi:hypothetical protein
LLVGFVTVGKESLLVYPSLEISNFTSPRCIRSKFQRYSEGKQTGGLTWTSSIYAMARALEPGAERHAGASSRIVVCFSFEIHTCDLTTRNEAKMRLRIDTRYKLRGSAWTASPNRNPGFPPRYAGYRQPYGRQRRLSFLTSLYLGNSRPSSLLVQAGYPFWIQDSQVLRPSHLEILESAKPLRTITATLLLQPYPTPSRQCRLSLYRTS